MASQAFSDRLHSCVHVLPNQVGNLIFLGAEMGGEPLQWKHILPILRQVLMTSDCLEWPLYCARCDGMMMATDERGLPLIVLHILSQFNQFDTDERGLPLIVLPISSTNSTLMSADCH